MITHFHVTLKALQLWVGGKKILLFALVCIPENELILMPPFDH